VFENKSFRVSRFFIKTGCG